MPDEPGRGDASWLDGVDVPDDPRELQADIDAYHRERRQAARRRRLSPLVDSGWWQRYALPAAVAVGSLTIAAAVLAILTFDRPQRVAGPAQAPIATAPRAGVGEVDGLIPDVRVRTALDRLVSIRDFRPALVALVPLHCDCTDLLSRLAGQAATVGVRLVVVAPTWPDAEVATMPGRLHSGEVQPAFDQDGRLAAAYDASGVTALVLRPDATVSDIERNVDSNVLVTGWLSELLVVPPSMHSG